MPTFEETIDAKFPPLSLANPTNSDLNAVLSGLVPLAEVFAAQIGASADYPKTTDGAQTLIAANESSDGDRVVLIVTQVIEVFADGDGGTQTTFTIGQTGSATKFAAAAAFTDAALGTVNVFAGVLTEETALIVTANDAAGAGTGGLRVTAFALPATSA